MLNNISKEIFYYSFIPFTVVALIIIVLLIVGKKKNDNYFKYNYFIKVLLSILITIILTIMIGYTVWVIERVINMEAVTQNILYLSLLGVIVISLFLSLIIILVKLYKSYESKKEPEKKLQS